MVQKPIKVLIIGAGKIGLGLIMPVFKKAGYEIVVTDKSSEKLKALEAGICQLNIAELATEEYGGIKAVSMELAGPENPDIVITCVGVDNLPEVARSIKTSPWLSDKQIMLTEDLVEPMNIKFKHQIPFVVDRLCSKYEIKPDVFFPIITVEPQIKISAVSHQFLWPLQILTKDTSLSIDSTAVERIRLKKMFTINLARAIISYKGFQKGFDLVEDAVKDQEITELVNGAIFEIGSWIKFEPDTPTSVARYLISRFSQKLGHTTKSFIKGPPINNFYLKSARDELLKNGFSCGIIKSIMNLQMKAR